MRFTRRELLWGAAGSALAAPARPAARPNVVVILADDLAAWMLGCYGNREIRTPNIDTLARTGTRFRNSFVCTPICSASRATLFTGRTPSQHGIHDFLTDEPIAQPPQGQKEIPASFAHEVMISDILAQAGYQCGYVGKWHLDNGQKPQHHFTYTYTMEGGGSPYQNPVMFLNGEKRQESGYLAELMTNRAVEFIGRQSASQPFFLTVGYFNPHTPYTGHPQEYYDLYANTKFESFGIEPPAPNALREKNFLKDPVTHLRQCAASVTALDDQIPALLKALQDRGLRDNTVVVFAGDNGFLLGRHGLWSKGLASDPINMYEEVMGVPMIWSWPGRVPAESVRPELVSFYDFLPAICEATGTTPPAGRNLCGRSYLPLVTGQALPKKQPWRNLVYGQFRNTEMARDTRYKLILRNGGQGPNELYDLTADSREKRNLTDNPQYVDVQQQLTKEIESWRARTRG